MANLTELLLNGLATYGAVILGLVLILGALGTPVPSSLMVVASGAFARQGLIDWPSVFVAGLVGAVIGDMISYMLGRSTNGWIQRRFGQSSTWQATQDRFEKCGGLTIYLSRFLFIPLAIPANLIAGSSGYGLRRFLIYDIAGEFTWLILYSGLGYVFGRQWQLVTQMIAEYSTYLVGMVVIGAVVYFLGRYLQQRSLPKLSSAQV